MQETTNPNDQIRATDRLIEDICIQRETMRARFAAVSEESDRYTENVGRMIENADKLLLGIYTMIGEINDNIAATCDTLSRARQKFNGRTLSVTVRPEFQASNVVPLVRPQSHSDSPKPAGDDGLPYAEANM
jgi:hypothetical protein